MTASADALWLATLQKLTGRISHDLKGALNGVSVNLEVVRSRSEREGATGADVHRFAASAADQNAIVIRVTTALLSLARGTRGPVEVSMVARQLANLLEETGSGRQNRFAISAEGGMSVETAASLSAVRLVLAECLLAVADEQVQVTVMVTGLPAPTVRISPGRAPALPDEAQVALAAAGIRIVTDGHGISISLPGPPDLPH